MIIFFEFIIDSVIILADPRPGSFHQLRPDGRSRRLPDPSPRETLRIFVAAKSQVQHHVHVVRITQPRTGQVRLYVQQLQEPRRDALPLHRVRRFRPVHPVLRQRGPPAQDGEARLRLGRRFVAQRPETGQPARSQEVVDPAVHPLSGARVSMSRRELSPDQLSEDEEGGDAHQNVQAKDERRLSDMQTVDSVVLLPRETLPRDQVSGAVLFEHQTQVETAAAAAATAAGAAAAKENGRDEHENFAAGQRDSGCEQRGFSVRGAVGGAGGGQSGELDELVRFGEQCDGNSVTPSARNRTQTGHADAAGERPPSREAGAGGSGQTAGAARRLRKSYARWRRSRTEHASAATQDGTHGHRSRYLCVA
jgi:hypothetical protein